jgi:hypothetical protein
MNPDRSGALKQQERETDEQQPHANRKRRVPSCRESASDEENQHEGKVMDEWH